MPLLEFTRHLTDSSLLLEEEQNMKGIEEVLSLF